MTDVREEAGLALQYQWRATAAADRRRRAGVLPVTAATAAEVAAAGATRRQLDYWVEMGWVVSATQPARGHPRSFTATERKVLALLVRLTAAGFPARMAAPVARSAVREAQAGTATVELAAGLVLTVRGI